MFFVSRLLSRFSRSAPTAPLADFNAIFAPPGTSSESKATRPILPDEQAEPIPDPIADAIHGAQLDPAARAEALVAWAGTAHEQLDSRLAIQGLLGRLAAPRLLAARRAVAAAAMAAHPGEAWPYAESAAASLAAGDQAAALATVRDAAGRFPADLDIVRALLDALAAGGDPAAAHRACVDLAAGPLGGVLAQENWFLRQAIPLAHRAGDHANTLAWSAGLRAQQPDTPPAYTAAVASLRLLRRPQEAVSLAEEGLRACPDAVPLVLEAAHAAEAAGQSDAAYAYWERLRALMPRNPAGHTGAARLSVKLVQPSVTRDLLLQGLTAFPADRDLLLIAAREAIRRCEWDQAATYWDSVIALSTDKPALALMAARSFIGPPPGRKQRLPGVLARMEAIHAVHPDFVPAYTAYLQTLREAGRVEEAAARGDTFAALFPQDHGIAIARARIAEVQNRPDDALGVLRAVQAATPPSEALDAAHIRLLRLADSLDEADSTCAEALARFPRGPAILCEHVAIATRRGEFAEALARARQAAAVAPGSPEVRSALRRAEMDVIGSGQEHDGSLGIVRAQAPERDGRSFPETLARFESLGGSQAGCEFGLFQREFAVETLGLLRWASIPIEGLIAAIHARFAGLGSAENTILSVRKASADNHEYCLADRTYGFWTHTFVKTEAMSRDMMLKQSLRRLTFLRGKLVEDFQDAQKIFAYKLLDATDPDADFQRLFDAILTCGPCTLLCIAKATSENPKGTLRMLRPGLFVGHSLAGGAVGGPDMRIDTDNWRSLCQRVAEWHNQAVPA